MNNAPRHVQVARNWKLIWVIISIYEFMSTLTCPYPLLLGLFVSLLKIEYLRDEKPTKLT